MTIEFHCPSCGKFLQTTDDKAEAMAKCPGCTGEIRIPNRSEELGQSSVPPIPSQKGHSNSSKPFDETVIGETNGPTKSCPLCGETVKAAAVICRFCGEDFAEVHEEVHEEQFLQTTPYLMPHRGGMLLALGIIGLVTFFFPLSIVTYFMAANDLKEIKANRMDPEGEGADRSSESRVADRDHSCCDCYHFFLFHCSCIHWLNFWVALAHVQSGDLV